MKMKITNRNVEWEIIHNYLYCDFIASKNSTYLNERIAEDVV